MRAAVISNQEVVNIIEIDYNFFLTVKDNYNDCILEDVNTAEFTVNIGDKFVNNKFLKKVPSNGEQKEKRRIEYELYADPLFFKWQRGEASSNAYEEQLKIIKLKYPYYYDEFGNLNMDEYEKLINPLPIVDQDNNLSSDT